MIFSKKKKVLSAMLSLAMIGTMVASVPFTASADATTTATPVAPGVSYSTQIQSIGWQAAVADGALSGTVNKAKRLEAIKINLTNAPAGASISYKTQVQSFGWQAAVSDGAVSGTVGKAKRLETIKITLNGLPGYSVKYQVQGQTYGWQAAVSTKNGTAIDSAATAGTVGQAKRLEAIKITIVKDPVTTVSVSSVAATSAKTLAVTFSDAVTDTSAVTFTTVRGTSTTTPVSSLTATWNTAKTQATLTAAAKLTADTYKVTAAGSNVATTGNSASVAVTAQTVTKIKINSSELVKNSTTTPTYASFGYTVYDQYGVDITASTSTSNLVASCVLFGTYATSVNLTASTGIGKVTPTIGSTAFTTATTLTTAVLTLTDSTTGATATSTLNVVSAASIASLTLGTPTYSSSQSTIVTGSSTAVTYPVTAVDQYGNTITDYTELVSGLTFAKSDSNLNPYFSEDANNNPVLILDTSAISSAETAVVTFINSTSGKTFPETFTITLPDEAYNISLGDFSSDTIAVGDSGLVLDATITDQFGNTLTPSEIASNATLINGWFTGASSSTTAGFNGIKVCVDSTSANYGKLVTGTVAYSTSTLTGTSTATVTLVVTSTSGTVSTKNVVINAARYIDTVTAPTSATLLQGATHTSNFTFYDQYGAKIAYSSVLGGSVKLPSGYQYTVALTRTSGTAIAADGKGTTSAPTLTSSGIGIYMPDGVADLTSTLASGAITYAPTTASSQFNDSYQLADIGLNSSASGTGVYKLTVSLLDASSNVVSSAAQTVTTQTNTTTALTYSAAALGTLNGSDTGYSTGATGTTSTGKYLSTEVAAGKDPYATSISVTGKDSSGNSYDVSPNDIISVTATSGASYVDIEGASGSTWYVAGIKLSTAEPSSAAVVAEPVTLSIVVNTQSGLQTVTTTATVSPSAPAVSTVKVINPSVTYNGLTVDALPATGLQNSATQVSLWSTNNTFSIAATASSVASNQFVVAGEDQYNVWNAISSPTVVVNSTSYVANGGYSTTAGVTYNGALALGLTAPSYLKLTSVENVNVTFISGTGSAQVVVTQTAPVLLAANISITYATITHGVVGTTTPTLAATDGTSALNTALYAGGTYSISSATGVSIDSSTGAITLTASSVAGTVTVTYVVNGITKTASVTIAS
jgi:uncharacterized protein YjdB